MSEDDTVTTDWTRRAVCVVLAIVCQVGVIVCGAVLGSDFKDAIPAFLGAFLFTGFAFGLVKLAIVP